MSKGSNRISYDARGVSHRIFYGQRGLCAQIELHVDTMTFTIRNPNNMLVLATGPETEINNIRVLKRAAKRTLCEVLGVEFEKEDRPHMKGKSPNAKVKSNQEGIELHSEPGDSELSGDE